MKAFIFPIILFLAAACASIRPPIVASAEGLVAGHLRTDGVVFVAAGIVDAEFALGYTVQQGVVFPIVEPVKVNAGEVLLINRQTGERITQTLEDPLPEWAQHLYGPSEWETIVSSILKTDVLAGR